MTELNAQLILNPHFVVGDVPRRLFGGFVEHGGRGVYNGLFEPEHPTSGSDGFRGDVLELVRKLGITTVRYPGGNYVSGHRWEDGTGPRDARPARLDYAWHLTEPNLFGLDEFSSWCAKADVEPMLAVNLGTRGVLEALDMLEYCNGDAGTMQADRRRANGYEEPFNVRIWCLGNEPDGPWQLGHTDAAHYGRIARQTASAMRMFDPTLELVVAGSSGTEMPTYGSWERTVLEETYDDADFISAHQYYFERDGDQASFLASSTDFDSYLDSVVATLDHVKSVKRSKRRVDVSVDEWGVWYQNEHAGDVPAGTWPVAPHQLEDFYSVADAVVYGSMLITLLKHVDRVRAANAAQLVNVIAPIMTDNGGRAWKQAIFHPFAAAAKTVGHVVLQTLTVAPTTVTERFGEVSAIDAVGIFDPTAGVVRVFAVNRSTQHSIDLAFDLSEFGAIVRAEASTFTATDTRRKGDGSDADPQPTSIKAQVTDAGVSVALPPVSWNEVVLHLGENS